MKKFLNFIQSDTSLFIGLISLIITVYSIINMREPSLEFNYKIIEKENSIYNTYSIVLLTVTNNGDINLKKNDYADIPFGLKISNGSILEKNIPLKSDDAYISENLKIDCCNNNTMEFSKIFFDIDKSFQITFDVLSSLNTEIIITPFGKISGLDKILIYENKPFCKIIYEKIGNIFSTFISFMGWYILFALLFYTIKYLILFIYSIFVRNKAKNIFDKEFKKDEDFNTFHFFYKQPIYVIEFMKKLLVSKKDIVEYYNYAVYNIETKKYTHHTVSEANFHVREKGSGSEDEEDIYYSEILYEKFKNNFFKFKDKSKLIIKNEDILLKYIDTAIKFKQK